MAGYETALRPADADAIAAGAALLQKGEVVAFPTETVYGLGANALNEQAVEKIFAAKGRPQDNPLIVHVASAEEAAGVVKTFTPQAQALADAFWPGPLTLVLPKTAQIPNAVSAGLSTVGVRMPDHPVALALIREAGMPLAAPSANASGRPSPTTAGHVLDDMKGRIPLVLDGGPCRVGVESTVLSLVEEPVVLRPGGISPEQISQVLGVQVPMAQQNYRQLEEGAQPQSPGMKYKHYAPNAKVLLVQGSLDEFARHVAGQKQEGSWALCFEGEAPHIPIPSLVYGKAGDEASQAAALFAVLRELDVRGAKTVYVRCPQEKGLGYAVYNRLLRAAAFCVIEV